MLEIITSPKPKLPDDAPAMIDLFSGGGGVKTGAVMAGFRPVIGVEKDPKNPKLSQVFKECQQQNFGEYGSQTILETVQDMALKGWKGIPRQPLYAHASPVCTHFSGFANVNHHQESATDVSAAIAICNAIAVLQAQYWTIEQVTAYKESQSFKMICETLTKNDYIFVYQKVDFYDFGVSCQNRKRLFLIAWKRDRKPLSYPPYLPRWGWIETLKGIPLEHQPNILGWMQKLVDEFSQNQSIKGLIVQRNGKMNHSAKIRRSHEPIWTITKHSFHDNCKHSRRDPFNIYLPGQGFFFPHPRAIARMCGFPDWFQYPKIPYHWGSIFGYAVTPTWIYHFLKHNFS